MSSFSHYAEAAARAKILVVGDVMLDRYWFGEVSRISPEAPVPIVKITKMEERPGGAANVARNAAALGAQVTLLSVVGDDEPGHSLERMLTKESLHTSLYRDSALPTTVKLRVISKQQQLLRIDFETPPSHEVLHAKLNEFRALLTECTLVVMSDYGKGGLTHISQMIEAARALGKPVLVDPKGDDYHRYRGASLLTPNLNEFRQVAGRWKSEDELTEKAHALCRELELDGLLITRSEEGMTLFYGGDSWHVPAQAREVYDVSGAGDTVIATLGVMLAAQASLQDAVRVANQAAGIVVGKLGTAVVQPSELP